jgi:hypothetical protein
MLIFGLRPGESTTRDIILEDACARFQTIQYLVRAQVCAAIDAGLAAGTLVEKEGRIRTDGMIAWMLNIEMPADEDPLPRVRRSY